MIKPSFYFLFQPLVFVLTCDVAYCLLSFVAAVRQCCTEGVQHCVDEAENLWKHIIELDTFKGKSNSHEVKTLEKRLR